MLINIIGIVDRLNELNDKLSNLLGNKLDNVVVGTIIMGVLIAVAIFGINELNK